MALQAAVVAVGTSATRLDAADVGGDAASRIRIKNTHATNTLFLGPAGVTTATGYVLAVNETVEFELRGDDALYGIAVAASTASVVRTGV